MEGVMTVALRQFHNDLGAVYHMIRASDDGFAGFGEVYFSIVAPRATKAWKRHREKTCNLVCVVGNVELVLYDDRPDSESKQQLLRFEIGEENYQRVTIPNGIWFGFQNRSSTRAILANCANLEHDPAEGDELPIDTHHIPHRWSDV